MLPPALLDLLLSSLLPPRVPFAIVVLHCVLKIYGINPFFHFGCFTFSLCLGVAATFQVVCLATISYDIEIGVGRWFTSPKAKYTIQVITSMPPKYNGIFVFEVLLWAMSKTFWLLHILYNKCCVYIYILLPLCANIVDYIQWLVSSLR